MVGVGVEVGVGVGVEVGVGVGVLVGVGVEVGVGVGVEVGVGVGVLVGVAVATIVGCTQTPVSHMVHPSGAPLHCEPPEHEQPQAGQQGPQSDGHELQFSIPLQIPSPHQGHAPQSAGHVVQSSVQLQIPSGQTPPHCPSYVHSILHPKGARHA